MAQRQAQQAIQANRHSPEAWALRGDVLGRQSRVDEAMVSYHRALSLQEHYPHVQLALAEIYRQRRRPRRVLSTLDSLTSRLTPGEVPPRVLYLQGLAMLELQRYDDAVTVFSTAVRQDEPNGELLYHLGEAQLLAGDVTNARLAVQAALARVPDHQPSRELHDRIGRQQRLTAAR